MQETITISNERLSIAITNYGGRVMRWIVDGVDIIMGFDEVDQYKTASEPYHGAIIGRYANRIANAKFTLNNKEYYLNQNHGKHLLHGGDQAFHNTIWTILSRSKSHVEMQLISPDGDQGFPGELTATARYELQEDGLSLSIKATTTAATPINMTHHPYFNLSGLPSSDLEQHQFMIHSNKILPTTHDGIPTGDLLSVSDTGFDFEQWKSLKQAWKVSHPQIETIGGIDHTYIMPDQSEVSLQAEAKASDTNVHMQVHSNQPGVQFYTANHFEGKEKGKIGRSHVFRGAFCFEPQRWPDSPNQQTFPNTILQSDEEYSLILYYKFPKLPQ